MRASNWIKGTLISLALVASPAVLAESVNINTADAQALAQVLDGVGPAKAKAIIEYRQTNGPFKTVDDLERVPGIGKSTMEKNRSRMSVEEGAVAPKAPKT
jgi:competence protein ComEA